MHLESLEGSRVGILGYGREGQSAASLLSRKYPQQSLTLFLPHGLEPGLQIPENAAVVEGELKASALIDCEVLIKSPGISIYHPAVQAAIESGVRLVSGSQLWFAGPKQPRTAIISGSKGKSTTCALTRFLLCSAKEQALIAGNFGTPLLDLWPPSSVQGFLIVELSSYQTTDFQGQAEVALLTNLFPEHTDWHGTTERYYHDKLKLFEQRSGICFGNARDQQSRQRLSAWSQLQWFNHDGGWLVGNDGVYRHGQWVSALPDWRLRGEHNLANLAAALSIVDAFGVDVQPGLEQLSQFTGLPHRLQSIGQVAGISLVDDSIATAPEATIAALDSFESEVLSVIVGGFDRDIDWSVFGRYLADKPVYQVITQGENGPRIAKLLAGSAPRQKVVETSDLAAAVELGLEQTPDGGVLLLSPGAPSYGQFSDFQHRGLEFARLAGIS